MSIYLVQHGMALPKHQDPERPLSDEGRAHCNRIAEVAAGYDVKVDRIEHSGKLRAQQTADIMAAHLNPPAGVHVRPGLAPNDDVAGVAETLDPAASLMLVGHLPFMERLIGFLVLADAEQRPFKMQGGGIVCLDRDDKGWHIRWTLMPLID